MLRTGCADHTRDRENWGSFHPSQQNLDGHFRNAALASQMGMNDSASNQLAAYAGGVENSKGSLPRGNENDLFIPGFLIEYLRNIASISTQNQFHPGFHSNFMLESVSEYLQATTSWGNFDMVDHKSVNSSLFNASSEKYSDKSNACFQNERSFQAENVISLQAKPKNQCGNEHSKIIRYSRKKMLVHEKSQCSHVMLKISLMISGYPIMNALWQHWTEFEQTEGRRMFRVTRQRNGVSINAHFDVIDQNCFTFPSDGESKYLVVSCLYNPCKNSDEHFYITSVEVLKLVNLLIGYKETSTKARKEDKGRIRSNLCSYLEKPCSGSEWQSFLDRINDYSHHKPIDFPKEVRLMKWSSLNEALQKAVLFYRAYV